MPLRWLLALILAPNLAFAAPIDVTPILGESWYGLYLNGQKAGYARSAVVRQDDGNIAVEEDAVFRITMAGIRQDMRIFERHVFAPDGRLVAVSSEVNDPAGAKRFDGTMTDAGLKLVTDVGGAKSEQLIPTPGEDLSDAVKSALWVRDDPQLGDTITYDIFMPMYQQEIGGTSTIVGIEQRVFDSVPTKVYKIKTTLSKMGIESLSYVASDGTTLEDVAAGIITMRLEPEEVAKDVNYNNDVIVSNAAFVDEPIEKPRQRERLALRLSGPLKTEHLFNDKRQTLKTDGDAFRFEARRQAVDEASAPTLPLDTTDFAKWVEPTVFIQSDDPAVRAQAEAIAGDEKNAWKVVKKLNSWVYDNVESTFSAQLTNAVEVLDKREGDCTEHSVLFIGFARALGIPARAVAGLVYVDPRDSDPGFYFHQWAKVWVGQWVDVDPTFNQPRADVTHIKLAEGDLFEQTRLIPIIGNLAIEVLEETAPAESGAS